jgi:polyisoprenoid-binding protein YceI
MSSFNASALSPRPTDALRRAIWVLGVSLAASTLSTQAYAGCQYAVTNQWNNGFSATIKITNTGASAINGWDINWQYSGDNRITSSYNTTLTGSNPYTAKNLSWNGTIQPNQTVEFGVQGSKGTSAAEVPVINGAVCATPGSSSVASISSQASSSSSVSSQGASGCNGNALFCLDFEDVAPGTIPTGFTKEGTGIDVVQGQEARSGTRSVKFTSTNYANSGYFKKASVTGKHWGRLYYKMKTPVPNINSWLHGTFVAARSGSAEFRFVDTVQEASGKHQYLYNVEPGDIALQGAYAYQFDNAWVCTEWYVDNQTQTYRFFRNGEELAFSRNGTTTNATNLPGFAPVPATLDWLGFGFRSYQQSSGVEGWLDDVALSTERIGCNTPSSSSVASSSTPSSVSSASSSMITPPSSIATSSSASSMPVVSSSSIATSSSSNSSSSAIHTAAWNLDSTASYLNFVTTKNTHNVEVHNFTQISGAISTAGVATLAIDLSSVNTSIALRDERMRDLLFQTASFPTATATLNLPSGLLAGLAVGDTSEIQISASLDLHGVSSPVTTKVSVQRLSATRILVQNLSPIVVNAPDHALTAGVEALRAAVGIASISTAVPVDFTLIYDAR